MLLLILLYIHKNLLTVSPNNTLDFIEVMSLTSSEIECLSSQSSTSTLVAEEPSQEFELEDNEKKIIPKEVSNPSSISESIQESSELNPQYTQTCTLLTNTDFFTHEQNKSSLVYSSPVNHTLLNQKECTTVSTPSSSKKSNFSPRQLYLSHIMNYINTSPTNDSQKRQKINKIKEQLQKRSDQIEANKKKDLYHLKINFDNQSENLKSNLFDSKSLLTIITILTNEFEEEKKSIEKKCQQQIEELEERSLKEMYFIEQSYSTKKGVNNFEKIRKYDTSLSLNECEIFLEDILKVSQKKQQELIYQLLSIPHPSSLDLFQIYTLFSILHENPLTHFFIEELPFFENEDKNPSPKEPPLTFQHTFDTINPTIYFHYELSKKNFYSCKWVIQRLIESQELTLDKDQIETFNYYSSSICINDPHPLCFEDFLNFNYELLISLSTTHPVFLKINTKFQKNAHSLSRSELFMLLLVHCRYQMPLSIDVSPQNAYFFLMEDHLDKKSITRYKDIIFQILSIKELHKKHFTIGNLEKKICKQSQSVSLEERTQKWHQKNQFSQKAILYLHLQFTTSPKSLSAKNLFTLFLFYDQNPEWLLPFLEKKDKNPYIEPSFFMSSNHTTHLQLMYEKMRSYVTTSSQKDCISFPASLLLSWKECEKVFFPLYEPLSSTTCQKLYQQIIPCPEPHIQKEIFLNQSLFAIKSDSLEPQELFLLFCFWGSSSLITPTFEPLENYQNILKKHFFITLYCIFQGELSLQTQHHLEKVETKLTLRKEYSLALLENTLSKVRESLFRESKNFKNASSHKKIASLRLNLSSDLLSKKPYFQQEDFKKFQDSKELFEYQCKKIRDLLIGYIHEISFIYFNTSQQHIENDFHNLSQIEHKIFENRTIHTQKRLQLIDKIKNYCKNELEKCLIQSFIDFTITPQQLFEGISCLFLLTQIEQPQTLESFQNSIKLLPRHFKENDIQKNTKKSC